MANGFNKTNLAALFKDRYSKKFVESMTYKSSPFLALVPKREDMGGGKWVQPVIFEDPMSASADFATAQTASTSSYSRSRKFEVEPVEDFGIVTVKGRDIRASKGNENAFIDMVTASVDGIKRTMARRVSIGMYRKGWGAIGRVSSPGADTTLTLQRKEDIVNFAVGMEIVFSDTEGGSVLRDSGEALTVNAIDRNAGTMTVSANETTIASIADGDYIFVKGDRESAASPTRRRIAGFEDWVPQSAPSSTTFFGVDRTTDTRLGGARFDGSSQSVEEALIDGAVLLQREGGQADHCFVNPKQFGNLVKGLGSKVQYVDLKAGTAGIGFRALELYTPAGTVKVIPDRDCPLDLAAMVQLDTWYLGSLGPVPDFLEHDGLESLRQSSDDGIEIRVGYYANLVCMAPGWNCNVKLAT